MNDNRKLLESLAMSSAQRSGLNSKSFRTLADEAGIKSSSVHYYFPEKSDLARALIERYSEEFFNQLSSIEAKRWGLRRKLKAFIAIFEDVAKHNKLCLCGMMAAEVESLDEQNQKLLSEYFTNTEKWLSQMFNKHRDELATDIEAAQLAKALLAGLEGALLLDRVVGDGRRLKAQSEIFLALLT